MEGTIRDPRIDEKARSIQTELEKWVRDNKILEVGKQLVFSLQIEVVPVVVEEKTDDPYDASIANFFSVGNLYNHNVPHQIAVRIANSISNGGVVEANYQTIREFLSFHSNAEDLLRLPMLGRKSVKQMLRVMRENGIQLPDEHWKRKWT